MLRKFMRNLFGERGTSPKIGPVGHELCSPAVIPTIADSATVAVVRPCATCATPLKKDRKVYCSVVCKNTDPLGSWRKGLLKGPIKQTIPKGKVKKWQPTKILLADPIIVRPKRGPYKKKLAAIAPPQEETPQDIEHSFAPLYPKYSTIFSNKTHRQRIKDFSKW